MNVRSKVIFALVLLTAVMTGTSAPARAWWSGGHKLCTLAAVAQLPADMPDFFKQSATDLAEMSVEPDNWKNVTTPNLKSTEQPEHYIDLEYLDGKPIPPLRWDLLALYHTKGVTPIKGGMLPHALQENYERLMLAFRDYRNRPDSQSVKKRAVFYAGWLAHYSQDAAMPLHTTIHFDGKPAPEAGAPNLQKGIHGRIDAYPEKNGFTTQQLGEKLSAEATLKTWDVIVAAIMQSHTYVEKCYALDLEGAFDKAPEKGRELMLERSRAAVKLTLDLWYSAWKNSDPARATIPQR